MQGNPLQIWTGNGQDNQRFTFLPSPGEPNGLPSSTPEGYLAAETGWPAAGHGGRPAGPGPI
ncbi:MAG TPA: hypothetical protein VF070_37375 [Streptosporangiaceae bacterium]